MRRLDREAAPLAKGHARRRGDAVHNSGRVDAACAARDESTPALGNDSLSLTKAPKHSVEASLKKLLAFSRA
jgi:hypothetical protein